MEIQGLKKIRFVVFDLGGVLIEWDPRFVYRTIFKTEKEINWFFENICTSDWNENQDAGYPIAKATEERVLLFPEWEHQIRAFYGRWEEMLRGPIHASVELFKKLRSDPELNIYALTNWSAETFPIALRRFDFLHWFDGRLVSGEEGTRKPFPEFYNLLSERFGVKPDEALFIDDNKRNIESAEQLGFTCIHFQNPEQLAEELKQLGLI